MTITGAAARPQPKIQDYAIIGDGRSIALISRAGSIDWLCWPRFESAPIFARLLDADRGGSWRIAPTAPAHIARRYVEHTNVLETGFENAGGRCVLTDVMTIASAEDQARMLVPDHEVLRHLRCERGEIEIEIHVDPRPDFGRARIRASCHERLGIRWQIGSQLLALRAEVPMHLDGDGVARGTVTLRAGDSVALSLTFDEDAPALLPPLGDAARERIERSLACWSAWIGRARYDGPYRERVLRSALAVKLMAFAPSGAIIAAPTTSLPERMGGELNWDYRFCWLRDAAFTAHALLSLGYLEDAQAFCNWLLHTTRLTRPELRVMYDVYGNRPVRERALLGVRGYRDSRPVRTGNAAFDQLQLDCYGEVIDATAQIAQAVGSLDRDTRKLVRDFGDYVCRNWRRPDHGIWEPRGIPEHRTHSRLLCWVALDRLIGLADQRLVDRIDRGWLASERAAIRADIEAHAFDPSLGCYTGAFGNPDLDASVLLMTWYGFHGGHELRMRSTFARLQDRLAAGPGLLYRYSDSLRSGEGAFWICSFWAAAHLAKGGGTLPEAHAMMTSACSYANDLGLMAEEIDPATGDALGNFPQAYTHVGLISAALSIEEHAHQIGALPHV
ncbi:MAG: glycoside hydrolase family 15 protein, partial [Deltaproteobacteria bacterium]